MQRVCYHRMQCFAELGGVSIYVFTVGMGLFLLFFAILFCFSDCEDMYASTANDDRCCNT